MLFLLTFDFLFCFLISVMKYIAAISPASRALQVREREREAWLSRFHSGEMGPLFSLYPLSHLWQLTLLKVLIVVRALPI